MYIKVVVVVVMVVVWDQKWSNERRRTALQQGSSS